MKKWFSADEPRPKTGSIVRTLVGGNCKIGKVIHNANSICFTVKHYKRTAVYMWYELEVLFK